MTKKTVDDQNSAERCHRFRNTRVFRRQIHETDFLDQGLHRGHFLQLESYLLATISHPVNCHMFCKNIDRKYKGRSVQKVEFTPFPEQT